MVLSSSDSVVLVSGVIENSTGGIEHWFGEGVYTDDIEPRQPDIKKALFLIGINAIVYPCYCSSERRCSENSVK